MTRTIVRGALLVGFGAMVGALVTWRGGRLPVEGDSQPRFASASNLKPAAAARDEGSAALVQRLERLTATLAAEANERQRLEARLAAIEEEIAALRPTAHLLAPADEPAPDAAPAAMASNAGTSEPPATEPQSSSNDSASATERALIAAGVDSATAADLRRRRDEITLSALYLRDQAEREQWLNTPQFREQMEEIQGQQPSVRDEIGDDAYDRYLAALGEPNRVTVAEVMLESAAADAGLVSGDVVLRYGDARVFAPDDLVAETRAGNAGETVRVEILRNGRRLEINVPRGPLGLRIAAGHGDPNGG